MSNLGVCDKPPLRIPHQIRGRNHLGPKIPPRYFGINLSFSWLKRVLQAVSIIKL